MNGSVHQELGVATDEGTLLADGVMSRVEASLRKRGLVTPQYPRRGLLALGHPQRHAETGTPTDDRPYTPEGRPICRVSPAARPESATRQGEAAAWPAEGRPPAMSIQPRQYIELDDNIQPHEFLEVDDEYEDWRDLETELYQRLSRWGAPADAPEENWD